MPDRATRRLLLQRAAAALLVVILVPLLVGISAAAGEQPIREGEPAPRTVRATQAVREEDREATEEHRRQAREGVDPVIREDSDAQSAIVRDARNIFAETRAVREPRPDPDGDLETPPTNTQISRLRAAIPDLPVGLAEALVSLSGADLDVVERETVSLIQGLAAQPVRETELERVVEDYLSEQLAPRGMPGDTDVAVAAPMARFVMRPTATVDAEATAAARDQAEQAAGEVGTSWAPGEAIVRENEIVDALQLRAIGRLGLQGTSSLRAMLRSLLAMVVVVAIAGLYLARMQPRVWASAKKLVLLSLLVTGYSALVVAMAALSAVTAAGWMYVVPAGALAMLVAILIHPVVGIAMMLPAAVVVLLVNPSAAPVALFSAAVVLTSVPLAMGLSSRSDLRSATLRAGLAYPLLAVAVVLVLGPRDELLVAGMAGAANGLLTVLMVQGGLPFLEHLFRLPTITALLDLSDRNHPLLRELEAKALGSYNHSVMVASLTERACRAVGADPLLGTVAALYHDIGKVRQPHFFIENQQGIANPHDDLEPEISAVIIQNHVVDGVEMAVEYRLPPEVVACIGSHHGTMLVKYFYDKAVQEAGGDPSRVDEAHFRYKGTEPRSKEAAILLLADCCEATTRAMAMTSGTLPRELIESTVDALLQERIDDGQFDHCDLTFREMRIARDTVVESLVGIYHPRIAYPSQPPEQLPHEPSEPAAPLRPAG